MGNNPQWEAVFKKTLGDQVKKVGIGNFMLSILSKIFLIQFDEPTMY